MDPLIQRFLETLIAERGLAQLTCAAYATDLAAMQVFLLAEKADWAQADGACWQRYFGSEVALGWAAATARRKRSAIKQFYRFLLSEGFCAADPTVHLPAPKRTQTLPYVLSEAQVNALLAALENWPEQDQLRLRALIELLYASGLRISELVALPLMAIKPQMDFMIVKGKGGAERLVPIHDVAQAAVAAYLPIRAQLIPAKNKKAESYLFPSRGKSGHLTRQRVFQWLKVLAQQAGIPPAQLSPHTLRHAFATHLLAGGADLRVVQQLLGHKDISTAQIYTHLADDALRAAVLQNHPLAKGA